MESDLGSHGAGWAVVSSMTPSATGTGPGDLGQQSLACQRAALEFGRPGCDQGGAAASEGRGAAGGRRVGTGAHPTSSSSSPFLMAQSV